MQAGKRLLCTHSNRRAVALGSEWIDPVAMLQRYYFHLVRGHQRIIDRTGIDLHDDAVMSLDVEMIMRGVWPGTAEPGEWDGWSVEIADQCGRIVRTIVLASSGA